MGMRWNNTWALGVLVRTLLPEGMAYEHAKMETSCLLLHVLVACTFGGAASGVSSPQALEVDVPCCQSTQCLVV